MNQAPETWDSGLVSGMEKWVKGKLNKDFLDFLPLLDQHYVCWSLDPMGGPSSPYNNRYNNFIIRSNCVTMYNIKLISVFQNIFNENI